MSVGAILTIGFGTFSSVNLVTTLGYGETVGPPAGGGFDVLSRRLRRRRRTMGQGDLLRQEIADRAEIIGRAREDLPDDAIPSGETVTYELDLDGISPSELDAEIYRLLHKKLRTEEEEIILLLVMVAVVV